MLRYRRAARRADVVHYQWLTLPAARQPAAARRPPSRADRPRLAARGGLAGAPGRAPAPALGADGRDRDRCRSTARRACATQAGIPAERVRVIPHGAFDYLTRLPDPVPLPDELAAVEGPVILCFGLIRPYKGVDLLLEAFRAVRGGRALGRRPAARGLARRRCASSPRGHRDGCASCPASSPTASCPPTSERADLVVLPHRDAEQSGVLYAALAFGEADRDERRRRLPARWPTHGAGRLVPAGRPRGARRRR